MKYFVFYKVFGKKRHAGPYTESEVMSQAADIKGFEHVSDVSVRTATVGDVQKFYNND